MMSAISSLTIMSESCICVVPCAPEVLTVPRHPCSVYPLIDPAPHFANKTYKNKTIVITGGSVGIGYIASLFYARAGANVLVVARRIEKLEKCKADILKDAPDAQISIMVGDISDPEVGKRAVRTAVDTYGGLDILLANHFSIMGGPMGSASSRRRHPRCRCTDDLYRVRGQGPCSLVAHTGGQRARYLEHHPVCVTLTSFASHSTQGS